MNEFQLSDRILKILEAIFKDGAEEIHDMIFDPNAEIEDIVKILK